MWGVRGNAVVVSISTPRIKPPGIAYGRTYAYTEVFRLHKRLNSFLQWHGPSQLLSQLLLHKRQQYLVRPLN